jgi:hypothetical protein
MRKLLLLPITLPVSAARGALEAAFDTIWDALEPEDRWEAAGAPPPEPEPEPHDEEPWDGYDRMSAAQVVQRLSGADAATRAAVRLYESAGRNRKTVLRATGT